MNDPYMSIKFTMDRWRRELAEHGKLIIGFDFDNTVYDCHKQGHSYPFVRSLLVECQERGWELICFTGNTSNTLVKEQCASFGLTKFTINTPSSVPTGTIKPYFNILLDDRAGLCITASLLEELLDESYV